MIVFSGTGMMRPLSCCWDLGIAGTVACVACQATTKLGMLSRVPALLSSCLWFVSAVLQDQSHLAVGCLDGQLKFFTSTGTPKFKERAMEGDVLSLSHFNTDYMLAGGSDK
jgi:hypothetical protein